MEKVLERFCQEVQRMREGASEVHCPTQRRGERSPCATWPIPGIGPSTTAQDWKTYGPDAGGDEFARRSRSSNRRYDQRNTRPFEMMNAWPLS
jgi:hypothetical protein